MTSSRSGREKIPEAVTIVLETPAITNVELAKKLGVTETTIRKWKQHRDWEFEYKRQTALRADAIKELEGEKKVNFQNKLEEQQRKLDTLLDSLMANAALSFSIANKAYKVLSKNNDPVTACKLATRAGIHIQSENAMKATKTIIAVTEQIYQLSDIHGYFKSIDVIQDKTDDEDDIYGFNG